jgi:hypothetical protein
MCLGVMETADRLGGEGGRRGVTMNLWYYLVSSRTVGHGEGGQRGAATQPQWGACATTTTL